MIREIKCPYGDDFEGGDECDRCEQYELCIETLPPINLIEIPEGATNGDMLTALFGKNALITLDTHNYLKDWWNAPYRR